MNEPKAGLKIFETIERRYKAYVERQDKALFEALKRGESLRPRLTLGKLLAFGLALLIHASTILILIVGIALIISRFFGPFSICYGALLIFCAVVVRPRVNKMPDEDIVPKDKFPTLYQFTDQIAADLDAPPIDLIIINEIHNASFGRAGYRNRRILTLGYPLWMQLDARERIALTAHELAHNVNGDFTRNWVVGGAINSLAQWYNVLYPEHLFRSRFGRGGIWGAPIKLVMLIFANIALLWALGLLHLLLHESRRAEYLADYLGAQVAGSEAAISLLTKIRQRQMWMKNLPITTHPPTEYRIEFLRTKYFAEEGISPSPEQNARIDAEFAALEPEMSRRKLRLKQTGRYQGG